MGQYSTLINISKRPILPTFWSKGDPIVFEFTGAKMLEQLDSLGNKPFLALSLTELDPAGSTNPIAPMGTWSGDRIVLIGNYSEDLPPFLTVAELDELQAAVLNLDKKEFLDPRKFHESETFVDEFALRKDGTMRGLYLLIFYSTGSGGGDVEGFRQGRWAGNHITIREKEKVPDLESWKDISEWVTRALNMIMEPLV